MTEREPPLADIGTIDRSDLWNPVNPIAPVFKHGHSSRLRKASSPEYHSWRAMIGRCYYPSYPHYERYGGRGITVCDHWRNDFLSFLADVGRKPEWAHSIDRIDNDGPYEPGNVRWATNIEQSNNRRSNHIVTLNGETRTTTEWSRRVGIPVHVIWMRLRAGWSIERTLTQPKEPRKPRTRKAAT